MISSRLITANPHDLLEIESSKSILHLDTAPSWVKQSLDAAPYVVVRRQPCFEETIAIGVRGTCRNERWASFVRPEHIKKVIPPFQLRIGKAITIKRFEAVPALQHLGALEEAWSELEQKWGPGGSVGFELASGYPAANHASDLDIILFAPTPFDHEFAQALSSSIEQISKTIDVLVEAPDCAFSLSEYAGSKSVQILLRGIDGPRMGADPWQANAVGAPVQDDRLLEVAETPA